MQAEAETSSPKAQFPLKPGKIGFLIGNMFSVTHESKELDLINFTGYSLEQIENDITIIDELINEVDLYLESMDQLVLYSNNKIKPMLIFGIVGDLKQIMSIEDLNYYLLVPTGNRDFFGVDKQLVYEFKGKDVVDLIKTIEGWVQVIPLNQMSLIIGKQIQPVMKVPDGVEVYDEVLSILTRGES